MIDAKDDDHFDDSADETIRACLDVARPKSFFLYAGAGSGKTRSLVDAIRYACRERGRALLLRGQRIGVITYTNAARDEIKQRLEYNPLVEVSTIHSFSWSLITGYNSDIRTWLGSNLLKEIAELEALQSRGHSGSKASRDRARSIESKRRRHETLLRIQRFTYSPAGDNSARDALNHSEVIAMTAEFLRTKPTLQRLLVSRYPALFIDESQDTNGHLMDALLAVQARHGATFCLGLFGDTMQRIYADGKVGLAEAIPDSWARPKKKMNHRCPGRVIRLINKIRSDDDGQEQRGRSDKPEGYVRIFILPEETPDKIEVEAMISKRMAEISGDQDWIADAGAVKILALEHHMAARRCGFEELFEALYGVDRLRTGLLDGSLPGIVFFTDNILPLIEAIKAGDKIRTAALVRSRSPLLDRVRLEAARTEQASLLKAAKEACDSLYQLCVRKPRPSLLEVLKNVEASGLFQIPQSLLPFVAASEAEVEVEENWYDYEDTETETSGWRRALETTFDQIEEYELYVRGVSRFGTHQGVKGLEFPRVMVIVNDHEARGFSFNYEKLFGVKQRSKADFANVASGRETTIDRTRRLFYVTCSRAEKSLAIVFYSSSPGLVRETVLKRGWFDDSEVEMLDPKLAHDRSGE